MTTRLEASSFYSKYPRPDHTPGDIWDNLSCYGALSKRPIRGLVLTPACDLSNHKVESLTYVPFVSVGEYFSTTAVLPALYKRLLGLAQAAGLKFELWREHRYELPLKSELDEFNVKVGEIKNKDAKYSLDCGIKILTAVASDELIQVPAGWIEGCFGKKQTQEIFERVVKNSYSTDLHFLPSDGLRRDYSAVPTNSIALFRYPLSVPLHVLDAAIETPSYTWSAHAASLTQRFPAARSFSTLRPIKLGTLEPRFFADLLTRYLSLMIRLGAPSFDADGVAKLVSSIP